MTGALPPPPPEAPLDDGFAPSDGTTGRRSGNGTAGRGYDRVPPHSLEAEVSVLGASLLSRSAAGEATEVLTPDDFYRGAHRVVFEGIRALLDAGEPIDTVTLTDWLARNDRLDEVGGPAALHDLTVATPTAANAAYYARIVQQKALLRRLIDAGTAVTRMGYEAADEAESVVDRAESVIYEVSQIGARSEYSQLRDLLNDSFAAIEKLAEQGSEVTGLATGFDDLDRLTSGLQPQNLIILAARPAMGKCLGSCRVNYPKTGEWLEVEELVARGLEGEPVQVAALDETGKLVAVDVESFHDNGVQPVLRLRTRSGRSIRATANHPFLTWHGWRELRDLALGDLIAVPRELPYFGDQHRPDAEVKLLGYLLGDGCLRKASPELTTASLAVASEAASCAAAFGTEARVVEKHGTRAWTIAFRLAHQRVTREHIATLVGVSATTVSKALNGPQRDTPLHRRIRSTAEELGYTASSPRNYLQERIVELGLDGTGSHDKFVPDVVFTLPREQVAMFLSRLFATDGSAWVAEGHSYFGISYCSVSERLIRDVQHLLLRFGILSRIRERQVKYLDGTNRAFELEIRDAANVRKFISEIGIFSKEEQCAKVLAYADRRGVTHTNTDLLPVEVWEVIQAAKGDRSWADVSAATGRPRNHNWHVRKRRPSRRLVSELADALDSDHLRDVATSDVLWDEIVSIEPAGEERVYDLTVPGLHNFVADDLVVHNSSLSLNLAQYVTVDLKKPAIIFTLEMSKLEVVNRMLSAEARIDSNKLKTGRLDDLDWRKLGDALGKLSDAPLFIDDTPDLTLMEIRAKCRRLKQKHGLDLVIVDYLQLMTSSGRSDNRQNEVAEISRGMKMLAKELNVPVIALSQLSRQPESRTDKRPLMSDLRESGCVTGDTRVMRADTGGTVSIGELAATGERDVPVYALGDDYRLVRSTMTHAFSSGQKPVFRLTLASGRTIRASANHPFYRLSGWTRLDELALDDRIAVPRRLPQPDVQRLVDEQIVMLAHLIGDGCFVRRQPLHYTSNDPANLEAVEAAAAFWGITPRRVAQESWWHVYLPAPYHLTHGKRNRICAWLDELGLFGLRSGEKFLPDAVLRLPNDQLATFFGHLWATDGHVSVTSAPRPRISVYYGSSSRRLVDDVRTALLRLGIACRIRTVTKDGYGCSYQLWIEGRDQQRRFLSTVPVQGRRGDAADAARRALEDVAPGRVWSDTLPVGVWSGVLSAASGYGYDRGEFARMLEPMLVAPVAILERPVARERLARTADLIDDPHLAELAESDVLWDRVVAIESDGVEEVFDATVPGPHNFVADGIVVHNSIEQDADIVAFIYRDEVYDEQSPDKGIAELIISKHRNGATGVIKLAFLDHLTKFANLHRGASGGSGGAGAGGAPTPM